MSMTRVSYILTNGKEVKSFKEAQMSGMGYKAIYTPVSKEPIKLSEKQKAMRVAAVAKA